jgi:hypothetical protein
MVAGRALVRPATALVSRHVGAVVVSRYRLHHLCGVLRYGVLVSPLQAQGRRGTACG